LAIRPCMPVVQGPCPGAQMWGVTGFAVPFSRNQGLVAAPAAGITVVRGGLSDVLRRRRAVCGDPGGAIDSRGPLSDGHAGRLAGRADLEGRSLVGLVIGFLGPWLRYALQVLEKGFSG
jgi:hypothetical protein